MKTLIRILTILTILLFSLPGWAMEMPPEDKAAPETKGKCPITQVVGDVADCLRCHVVGNFAVKDTAVDATRNYPTYDMKILEDAAGEYGYFLLTAIEPDNVMKFLDYLREHKIKRAVVEIFSPGGSLFGAWRIVGLFTMAKSQGIVIETRVHGFAASAGFLIFIAGSMEHRSISPQSEIMWHELMAGSYFKIETPTSSEEEAKILRHLQDTANEYIASRCNLTKEDLDQRVKNKEFWLNGKQAYEEGFADKLLTIAGKS